MTQYKIQTIQNGKVVNQSRVAKSTAQKNDWLPHWKANNRPGQKTRVVIHQPKKRKVVKSQNIFDLGYGTKNKGFNLWR